MDGNVGRSVHYFGPGRNIKLFDTDINGSQAMHLNVFSKMPQQSL